MHVRANERANEGETFRRRRLAPVYLPPEHKKNKSRLSFRNNRDREAYFVGLERKMSSAGLKWQGGRQFVPGKKGAGDGYQLSCGRFKMHVLEHER